MQRDVKIIGMARKSPSLRIICFHHAAGTPSPYIKLGKHLDESIELKCVQLPRNTGTTFDADEISYLLLEIEEKLSLFSYLPTVFFGHSMGGLLAYHFASELNRFSDAVLGVVISSYLPSFGEFASWERSSQNFWELLYDLVFLGGFPKHMMKDEKFVHETINIYRNDLRIMDYIECRTNAKLHTPLMYFGGREDSLNFDESFSKWSAYTSSSFDFKLFPGGHFYFADSYDNFASELALWIETLVQKPNLKVY